MPFSAAANLGLQVNIKACTLHSCAYIGRHPRWQLRRSRVAVTEGACATPAAIPGCALKLRPNELETVSAGPRRAAPLRCSFARRKLGCNAQLIVDEFGEKLLEELDYLQEARNIQVRHRIVCPEHSERVIFGLHLARPSWPIWKRHRDVT